MLGRRASLERNTDNTLGMHPRQSPWYISQSSWSAVRQRSFKTRLIHDGPSAYSHGRNFRFENVIAARYVSGTGIPSAYDKIDDCSAGTAQFLTAKKDTVALNSDHREYAD